MRTRRTFALCLLSVVVLGAGLLPVAVSQVRADIFGQNTASESYYRLDVPNGTVSARVEVTVQNAKSKETTTALLWAMPQAQNVVVKRGDETLTTELSPAAADTPTIVKINLDRALKPNAQLDLVMTYDVPSQQSEMVRLEAGATEALFVSQGPGSFVFLDVPSSAENVFDPGCLIAGDQPSDVKDAGLQRWVCGEVTIIALSPDDPKLLERCANLDDRCRQRFLESPYSAFVQSTSDPSLRGVHEEVLAMGRGDVKVQLRYFKRDKAWADKQWAIAKQALPLLESVYGFNYPHETLTMRQSHHIEIVGAAGVAFSNIGEVLLSTDTGVDEEVTIHELAHQWAGYQVETSWLWEGLAEYGTRVIAGQLGVQPRDWEWQSFGHTDPISTWWNGSSITNPYYWYGKSGAFWFEYEKAIGGRENMTRVLSLVDDYEADWPLDGEWFMDRGEEVSGANLDELFLGWVYNRDTATALLKSRRDAHTAVAPLRVRAAELGFTGLPTDLQENLDQWQFGSVQGQVADATKVLDDYVTLIAAIDAAGLPHLDYVKNAWNTRSTRGVSGAIMDQQNALNAIVNSTIVLNHETEDSPSMKQLAEARVKWAEGDLAEAARLGAMAATTSFNEDAAVKMIALARETEATFSAGFFGRIGLIGKDPGGDVDRAQAAYDAGDPTKAMGLAQGAYESWNGADRAGLMRLSALAVVMCILSGIVWWLLSRLDESDAKVRRDPYAATGGHSLGDADSRPSWKDWENSNQ